MTGLIHPRQQRLRFAFIRSVAQLLSASPTRVIVSRLALSDAERSLAVLYRSCPGCEDEQRDNRGVEASCDRAATSAFLSPASPAPVPRPRLGSAAGVLAAFSPTRKQRQSRLGHILGTAPSSGFVPFIPPWATGASEASRVALPAVEMSWRAWGREHGAGGAGDREHADEQPQTRLVVVNSAEWYQVSIDGGCGLKEGEAKNIDEQSEVQLQEAANRLQMELLGGLHTHLRGYRSRAKEQVWLCSWFTAVRCISLDFSIVS